VLLLLLFKTPFYQKKKELQSQVHVCCDSRAVGVVGACSGWPMSHETVDLLLKKKYKKQFVHVALSSDELKHTVPLIVVALSLA
jgi:hypothetical protein